MTKERTGPGLQILIAVIAAAATIAAALIGNWDSIVGPGSGDGTTAASSSPVTSISTSGMDPTPSTADERDPGSACEITIASPLAMILEEPAVFAQEVGSVPAGVYGVGEVRDVNFGSQEQRWFRINVDGRTGWIRDSTFDIASKSPACP